MFYVGKFGRLPPLDAILSRVVEVENREMPASVTETARPSGSKPQFSVKAKGVEGFVGSAWLNEGKFGKYISVKLRSALGEGSTIYLSPTRDNPEIL